MIEKSPEAFRTISEVADELDLPQHVLRFWETRFSQIKPLKRGGGRRYYRPEDVNLLKGIRHLLYGEGYTIKGVQRILKEQGVRHVAAVWNAVAEEAAEELPAPAEATVPPAVPPARPPAQLAEQPARQIQQPPAPRPVAGAEPVQPTPPPMPARPAPVASGPAAQQGLTSSQISQLKAALFELIECKRILDDTRRGT